MTNKEIKKIQKQKAREKENKRKLAKKRESKRLQDKEKREWEDKMEKEAGEEKLQPYVHPEKAKAREEEKDRNIKEQLEHNVEILQALEEEYLKDQASKSDMSSQLEEEGFVTVKEKLDELNRRAVEEVDKITGSSEKN